MQLQSSRRYRDQIAVLIVDDREGFETRASQRVHQVNRWQENIR